MRHLHYLLALAAGLLFFSCGKEPAEVETTLEVSPLELVFEDEATSTKFVSVTCNGEWSALSGESWIHLQGASGSGDGIFNVTVDVNRDGVPRTGSLWVKAGSESVTVSVRQGSAGNTLKPSPATFDGNKRSSTTYQLLVYSFADSDGDGVGDFKGIQNKLDYLDELGVTALWLSPIHPADSYHGYDVQDYYSANPAFASGTHTAAQAEADFKALVKAARDRGITIYIDYVLNHSGKGHPWFLEALSSASSPYRDYYFISSNPASDYKNYPMLKGTSYVSGEWASRTAGSPTITISKTTEAVTSGKAEWNIYLWPLSGGNALDPVRFVDDGNGNYHAVLEINGNFGMLIRKYMNWDSGSKFGAMTGKTTLKEGEPMSLVGDGADITFNGSGRYRVDLSNTTTQMLWFMCAFGEWMPDLNYGPIDDVTNNACFKDLAASADKWIQMGIGGFRLDAVKHICGGISSYNNVANRNFLKAWYERCNATYKAQGNTDDIFMVGEVWAGHDDEKYYYQGINSCFEFGYWPLLYKALTSQNASSYVSTVMGFVNDHKKVRDDAQTALFMTNHDHSSQTGSGEVRAADDLGKNLAREKQAAAMMLTSPGKPFVYQGEELGYWGNSKGKGDEYIRAPIVWDKAAKDCAKKGVNDKVDTGMLTGTISVEKQKEDAESLLNTYITWNRLRNTYPALASGSMSNCPLGVGAVAGWYMTSTDGSQKLLVIHNVASGVKEVTVTDSMDHPVAVLGGASVSGTTLRLAANSSVVFQL